MPFHNMRYDYVGNKVHVDAEHCAIRINVLAADDRQQVFECTHNIVERAEIWAVPGMPRRDYIISIYEDNVLVRTMDTTRCGRTIGVVVNSPSLGDTLLWFPMILEFQRQTGCRLLISTYHNELLHKYEGPTLKFTAAGQPICCDAGFTLGMFEDTVHGALDFRNKPLQKVAADILGIVYREQHLDLRHLAHARPIKERYAVIGTTSTMACKEWQNYDGWQGVVDHLRLEGYKVVCTPAPRATLKIKGLESVKVPEDLVSGALTYIRHADIFVGLASGLTVLARALGTPAVMISGFTEPFNEFKGITRVINRGACHGCYHDQTVEYDRYWGWCPRNRNFECTRRITVGQATTAIDLTLQPRQASARKRILCVLPHCSTGGMPQYFLEKLRVLQQRHDVYVMEWSYHGAAHVVQRRQVQELATEFLEMSEHHTEFQRLVDDIAPDYIHFEEFPGELPDAWILSNFLTTYRRPVIHTTHSWNPQPAWNATRYVFPSAFLQAHYDFSASTCDVIEYPITDKRTNAVAHSDSVLNVGILSPHKNQSYAVEVARMLPDTKFYFIGGMAANFKAYWEPLVNNAPPNCKFLGELGAQEISMYYATCGVLFHTSTIELCPIVFNEAISHGLPILTNWLPVYEHLSYRSLLNPSALKPEEDVRLLKALLDSERTVPNPNYIDFCSKVLALYED